MAGVGITWQWETLIEQVKSLCHVDPETGCWVWPRAKSEAGYGIVRIRQKNWRVTRAVLFALTGELHEAALHSCDNPPCCNPDHLRWGTRLQNQQEMARKNRAAKGDANGTRSHPERVRRGVHQRSAKLTDEQVVEIRARAASGETNRALSAAFGVSPGNISVINRRLTWRHVK